MSSLDEFSKIKSGLGRVSRTKDGFRYFVVPCSALEAGAAGFRVAVQERAVYGTKSSWPTVRKFVVDDLGLRSLKTVAPRDNA